MVTFKHYQDLAEAVIRWAVFDEDYDWLQGPCAQWWFKFHDATPERAYSLATGAQYTAKPVCGCGASYA